MALLLGPDGTPIQKIDPITQATLKFMNDLGAAAFNVDTYKSDDHRPRIYLASAYWTSIEGLYWETAAGRQVPEAIYRLVERILQTSQCSGCKRDATISEDVMTNWSERTFDPDDQLCIVAFDPETVKWRRACDGV